MPRYGEVWSNGKGDRLMALGIERKLSDGERVAYMALVQRVTYDPFDEPLRRINTMVFDHGFPEPWERVDR